MEKKAHVDTRILRLPDLKRTLRGLTQLRNRYLIGLDTLGLLVIPSVAILLRTESTGQLLSLWPIVTFYTLSMIGLKWIIFYRSGLYGSLWAYASIHELLVVVRAVSLSAFLEMALFYFIVLPSGYPLEGFPRSVPILSALLTAFHVTGVRFSIRVIYSMISRRDRATVGTRPVLIAGAGSAGIMVVRELQRNLQLGMVPIGFVDDDVKKCTKLISGIPVFGLIRDIPWVVEQHDIKEVIIAMPAVSGQVIRKVVQICKDSGIPSKITPGLFDILRGAARVVNVREIQLEDLLRREVAESNADAVRAAVSGARVLVTGAGGSIGSEIVRQLKSFRPSELLLLGHGETSVFHIMKELEEHPVAGMTVIPIVADVRDADRMQQVFFKHRPQIIFHAAAHKHVWLMEQNLPDAVTNNVLGTRVLVNLAEKFGVRRFVMISSDKAVNPTSVMGVTKRIAELIVQDAANRTGKGFVTVRFGNVLGSRGSVVPIFKHQIDIGGPVTVTHPEVTRYFMTIPEAVHLVLQAGSLGTGGEVFVLDMGEQLKVLDVARDVIRLSGYTEEEIGIEYTGLKPGEKMYEELFYAKDDISETSHPKISVSRHNWAAEYASHRPHLTNTPYESDLLLDVATLIEGAEQGDLETMNTMIRRIVPQYTPAHEYVAESVVLEAVGAPILPAGQPVVVNG